MPLTRTEKEAQVAELAAELEGMTGAVFTIYRGLSVREMTELRDRLREAGVAYRVVKYTLLDRALRQVGISAPLEEIDGPLAVAFGTTDVTVPARVLSDYARENEKLVISGGFIGKDWTGADDIRRLALLPSREELYARVVGSLAAPLTGIQGVLVNVPRGLASVLRQYAEAKSQ